MDPQGTPPDDMLAETIDSINGARVSQGCFADLGYPRELTRRIADRVLRESFADTFRMLPAMRPMRGASSERVHRRELKLKHPKRRGANAIDIELEPDSFSRADEVGAMLARDGLVHAACHAIREEKPPKAKAAETLYNLGIPTDLLAHVLGQSRDIDGQSAAAGFVHAACAATRTAKQAREQLLREHPPRPWVPTADGTLRSDAGDAKHSAAIVSLARAEYLFAPGDGGALDHVRACVRALAPSPIIALAMSPLGARTLLEVPDAIEVPCDHAPAQFVRDAIAVLDRANGSSVALVPRFPSRGEIGTPFAHDLLPGTLYGLSEAMRAVNPANEARHSPLHFHGGDILCWHDGDGAHVLVGEGTIARNTAMGLSESQAREAIARELNAVELVVLPAVTFHIDTCVSVLATPTGPAFLVADPVAAAGLIVLEGCERLRKAGALSPAHARAIAGAIARNDAPSNKLAFELLATHALTPLAEPGAPPLATMLCPGDADGGTASALRFLHAVDLVGALSNATASPPSVDAYFNSIRRSLADLELLREILQSLGTLHPINGGITGAHGVPAANMVHVLGVTLMPCFGGICARVDAANQVMLTSMGRRVQAIPSSESALRQGATRCSVVLLG